MATEDIDKTSWIFFFFALRLGTRDKKKMPPPPEWEKL